METPLFFHNCNDFTGSTRVLADIISGEYGSGKVTVVCRDTPGGGFLSGIPGVTIISDYFRPTICGYRIIIVSELIYRIHQFCLALKVGRGYGTFYINTIMPFMAVLAGRISGKEIICHVHEKSVAGDLTFKVAEFVFRHTRSRRIFVSKYAESCYPANGSSSEVRYNRLSRRFVADCRPVLPEKRKMDTVVLIASLNPAKGIDTFVEIAGLLPEYNFILIASTIGGQTLSGKIPDNLTCHFNVADIHPFLQKSDILLNLSKPALLVETFGMTVIEGLAYGLPVIVPAAGGPQEIVRNGVQGYCTDVSDAANVASLISGILGDREEYLRLSRNAFARSRDFMEDNSHICIR